MDRASHPKRAASIRTLLRTAFTLASLAWIIHWLRASGSTLALPPGFHWGYALMALILVPAGLFFRAWKWQMTVALLEPKASLKESFASYVGAVPLSLLTPGRLGELSRGIYFPYPSLHGLRASGLVAVDKYTDLLAVLAWSIPGVAALFGGLGAAGALAVLVVLLPLPSWLGRLRPSEGVTSQSGLWRWVGKIVPPAAFVTAPRMLRLTLAGCAGFGVEWIQFAFLLNAADSVTPFLPVAGMAALITLINSLQLTIAGLGVREGLAIALLGPMGISPEAAVFAAFSLFCLNLLIPACIGLAMKPHGLIGARDAAAAAAAAGRTAP